MYYIYYICNIYIYIYISWRLLFDVLWSVYEITMYIDNMSSGGAQLEVVIQSMAWSRKLGQLLIFFMKRMSLILVMSKMVIPSSFKGVMNHSPKWGGGMWENFKKYFTLGWVGKRFRGVVFKRVLEIGHYLPGVQNVLLVFVLMVTVTTKWWK